ncbi:hypothetical protein CTAYLR_001097 [Chrysophaeum taylorii]|uniref:Glycosyltransferase n=1 Tax=Chrysophaeum taylorii TaxID=2483200 RepID=A0AAD7UPX0_9STRA|nr:hypothetical protein CTAYLR_001097 [Chrysophaeum taylorii]
MIEALVLTRFDAARQRALARKIVGEWAGEPLAPPGFLDLEVRLAFDVFVEVYIDCPERRTMRECPKCLFLLEPEEVSGATSTQGFDVVFGHKPQRGNWRFFGHGGAWVLPENPTKKYFRASIICGDKYQTEGHKLRRAAWDLPLERFKSRGSVLEGGTELDASPPAAKAVAIAEFAYHVVVENVRSPGYFTEKLVDALLLKAVPIYYGAPDIGDYFDTSGFIIVQTKDHIHAALAHLTQADYEARRPAIERNFTTATDHWVDLQSRMQLAIDDFLSCGGKDRKQK